MTRRDKELDALIGRNVKIVFFDGEIIEGTFGFTECFSANFSYRRPGFYTCGNYDIRKTHIKKIEEA